MKKNSKSGFDKYEYYLKSVQSPEADADFIEKIYRKIRGKLPRVLREDFCGTFALCSEWVKDRPEKIAYGIDLDPEPLEWGFEHFYKELSEEERRRCIPVQASVLNPKLPKADIIAALNFSYFFFRERKILKQYFLQARKHLHKNGILVLDALGGSAYQHTNRQSDRMGGFTYFWELTDFNPIQQHAKFSIHFKRNGEKIREHVFKYEWRLWTLPELRDLLEEVGFTNTVVYWEGTSKSGSGNGVFKPSEFGDEAQSWICYIVAYNK